MQAFHLHQIRHYLGYLLRRQPGLRDLLPARVRPADEESLDDWTRRLPKNGLVEICHQWVVETLRILEAHDRRAHTIVCALVGLPGEWDLDDAWALAQETGANARQISRDKVTQSIETASDLGLLIPGREPFRYVVPFPVHVCLSGQELLDRAMRDALRRRTVEHFARQARYEAESNLSLRTSWRLSNFLYAFDQAVAWLEEATGEPVAESVEHGGNPEVPQPLAEGLLDYGRALGSMVAQRRSEQAWRWLMGAVVGAQRMGNPLAEADMFRYLGNFYRRADRLDEAARCLERAKQIYLQIPAFHLACLTSSALALIYRDDSKDDAALREFEGAWTLACEHGLTGETLSISNCAGNLCLQMRRPADARQWFMRGWKVARTDTPGTEQTESCINVARALRAEHQLDEALKWLSEAMQVGRRCADAAAQADICLEIANIWEDKEDPDGAFRWLEQALRVRTDLGDNAAIGVILCRMARCARLARRPTQARECIDKARTIARRHGIGTLGGDVFLELAEQALEHGEDNAACQAFLEAIERLTPIASSEALARIHYRLALILYRRQAIPASTYHMLAAQALARACNLLPFLGEIDPWIHVLAEQAGAALFGRIVENVSDQWEEGHLGGRRRNPLRSDAQGD